jgi:hypothetical protein
VVRRGRWSWGGSAGSAGHLCSACSEGGSVVRFLRNPNHSNHRPEGTDTPVREPLEPPSNHPNHLPSPQPEEVILYRIFFLLGFSNRSAIISARYIIDIAVAICALTRLSDWPARPVSTSVIASFYRCPKFLFVIHMTSTLPIDDSRQPLLSEFPHPGQVLSTSALGAT